MKTDLYTAIEQRRSIYGINKETVISDDKILEVIQYAVKHAPSAYNSQSARVVLLLGEHHNKLWDITKEILRKIVDADAFTQTEQKIDAFRNGYGSVLFFEDQQVVKSFQDMFPLYQENFPVWSQHSTGMLQYIVWTSLEMEGFGASLQHYSPLIDEKVKKEWQIPDSWKLIAQMPFGKPTAPPWEKEFKPLEERIKLFK